MRNDREYQICSNIAYYLRLKFPNILYHFDYAGLNLSKAQAGRMKAIQGDRGYPDLFILEARGGYHGLFLEIKAEGSSPFRKDGTIREGTHEHEQFLYMNRLQIRGYKAEFGVGFDECMKIIDEYLKS